MIDRILVYTDGAAEPNPGHAGIGVVIFDEDGRDICQHSEYIGERTNNEAEYRALIKALELAPKFCTRSVVCHSDSELLVRQLNRIYRIKKPHLLALNKEIRQAEQVFQAVEYIHVPREHERLQIADSLSREAIETRGVRYLEPT